ncbi:hypothetical protein [Sulfurimonas sp. SWIR-19]|nr:hypothetical protein [Sulfurimonas sp. SWIR-19]
MNTKNINPKYVASLLAAASSNLLFTCNSSLVLADRKYKGL